MANTGAQRTGPKRWLLLTALVLLAFLQFRFWLSPDGWPRFAELRSGVERQTQENKALRERNERLAAEVEDLKKGLVAVEERARSELGMIRRDETFFHVVESTTSPQSESR